MSVGPENPQPLPFARGLEWFRAALTLLRSQLARLLLLGLLLQLLAGLTQVPLLAVVFMLVMPALSAGMLEGMRQADIGRRPTPWVLFAAFREPGRILPLLMLGGLVFGLGIGVAGFTLAGAITGLDAATLARLEAGDASAVSELDPALLQRLLLALAAGLFAGSALSYFAVPLLWFSRLPLLTAIWQGIVALFRQWRALLALGLALGLLAVPVGVLSGMALLAQVSGSALAMFAGLFALTGMVLYQLLIFSTQYLAFRELFLVEEPELPEPAREDQLVA